MEHLRRIGQALADTTRLRILAALRGGELCACQLITLLEAAPSTVSAHCAVLRRAELIAARKHGRWMYYRLPDPADATAPEAAAVLEWLMPALADDQRCAADCHRLQTIRSTDPTELVQLLRPRRRTPKNNPARTPE